MPNLDHNFLTVNQRLIVSLKPDLAKRVFKDKAFRASKVPKAVLVAAQLSKARLTSSQLALIRYICATTIYLSSTSEIFINGLGIKLWPPMVLAVLSLGGIFAGMLLQVRAYLYLGALFLLMAMVTMVSHAHQRLEHVWPWWAFGITMGIAILVMFGLFEKRKNDLKQVVDRLQQWEL